MCALNLIYDAACHVSVVLQVWQLFSYTPDDTVHALVLAARRGPPPGTLLLVVLHKERA